MFDKVLGQLNLPTVQQLCSLPTEHPFQSYFNYSLQLLIVLLCYSAPFPLCQLPPPLPMLIPSFSQPQSQTQRLTNLRTLPSCLATQSKLSYPFLSFRLYKLQCLVMLVHQFPKLLINLTTDFMLHSDHNKNTSC